MKILILNASPRRHGTISQAVERFADGANYSHLGDFSDDTQVEIVNVNDLKFSPCRLHAMPQVWALLPSRR